MKKQVTKLPFVPLELITHLDTIFPDKAPEEGDHEQSIRFKAGQVSVVRFLKRMLADQNPDNTHVFLK